MNRLRRDCGGAAAHHIALRPFSIPHFAKAIA